MIWSRKRNIELTEKQRGLLLEVSKARSSSQAHKQRAEIILLTEQGYSQRRLVTELKVTHCMVNFWKTRWYEHRETALAYDKELTGSAYRKAIVGLLSDKSRPGCPGKFSAKQICQIMNVACEAPEASSLPLSHWTLTELAAELVRRNIVESISTSQLSVFLKSSANKTA